ncbi:hypothetical protein ATO12_05305 [Aquimarina atlantica]|uniref:Uncharacterized protein n=1 Tax=Aquimarina atlantica TaxID=1317122 RepID=A0A023BNY3_9FLAO|nr:hypothetical protein [Aquimarina atlantica]EZH71795.1 hypothetical protein ATO12_05305 [Aquimarina atlantica]
MLQSILKLQGITILERKIQKEIKGRGWDNSCPSEGSACDTSTGVLAAISSSCFGPIEDLVCCGNLGVWAIHCQEG